jgi:hypothetical protein
MRANATLLLCLGLAALTGCGGGEPAEEPRETGAEATVPGASSATAVGTIRGTLGDEDRSWSAHFMERDGDPTASSFYQTRRVGNRTVHMLSLGGHAGTRPSINESVRITINAMEPIADCPCTFENQIIEYWIDTRNRYETSQAVITVDRFEATSDREYRASGSFTGTLAGLSGVADTPTGDTLSAEGTFDIERILRTESGGT